MLKSFPEHLFNQTLLQLTKHFFCALIIYPILGEAHKKALKQKVALKQNVFQSFVQSIFKTLGF